MRQEEKTKQLLAELGDNRTELHEMITDIKNFRKKLDILLPEKVDYKTKWLIPERMKTLTEIIRAELSVRGQIDDSIKLEIEIRRKSEEVESESKSQDIRNIAKAIELMKKEELPKTEQIQ